MKRTFMKRTTVLIALLMLVSIMMAGCGTSSSDGETSQEPKATEVQTDEELNTEAVDDGREIVGNTYKEGLPIVKEMITIEAVTKADTFLKGDIMDIEMWDVLEQATNMHFEITGIPESDYEEKVNLLIAGDDLPEVFLFSIADITTKYYNTNQFVALDEMMEEWAPNYNEYLSDSVKCAAVSAQDGHVYATPYGESSPWLDATWQLFINTEWLDNLGLSMPTTTDEFHDVLAAFKEGDPNGNGLADELPLTIRIEDCTYLMGSFGLPIDTGYTMLEDGTFVYGPTREAFRDALGYIHTLYAEGLLDPESLTQGSSELQAKGSSAPNVIGSTIWFWLDDFCTTEETHKYDSVTPLIGPDGDQMWLMNSNILGAHGLSIMKNCQNPEAVLRWADYIITSGETILETRFGPEELGVIVRTDDNKIMLNTDGAPEGMTWEEWGQSLCIRDSAPYIFTLDDIEEAMELAPDTQRKLDYIANYRPYFYKQTLTSAHISYFADESIKQEAVTIETDLDTIVQDFIAEAVVNGITDEAWNTFQENLQKAKVDRFAEIRQASLDYYFETYE